MNRGTLGCFHRTLLVNRLADNIEKSSENFMAHRHRNRRSRIECFHAAHESVG